VYSAKRYEILQSSLPNYKQHITNNIDKILPNSAKFFSLNDLLNNGPKTNVLLEFI